MESLFADSYGWVGPDFVIANLGRNLRRQADIHTIFHSCSARILSGEFEGPFIGIHGVDQDLGAGDSKGYGNRAESTSEVEETCRTIFRGSTQTKQD